MATPTTDSAAASPENTEKCTYKVKAGDTLSRIAEVYATDLSTLTDLNPESATSVLQIGQVGHARKIQCCAVHTVAI